MADPRKAAGPSAKVSSPRQRARASRTKKLQDFQAKQRRIEDQLALAFEELGVAEAARMASAAAELRLAAALVKVRELGEKPQEIADSMELPIGEVQRLLKLAEKSPARDLGHRGADA